MVNQNVVLLTGANGFIGSQIAKRLLKLPKTKIIALVKAKNNVDAKNRLYKAWWNWPDLYNSIETITAPLAVDISKEKLGLNEKEYNKLIKNATHIIHCAAKWRFDTKVEDLWETNVEGTKNILELAKSAHINHKILRLSYISTAYVSGKLQGNISEDTLTNKYGFITEYERTKFEYK